MNTQLLQAVRCLKVLRREADGSVTVGQGDWYALQKALKALDAPATASQALSPRQSQVLRLIAEGNTTKAVADLLGISEKTAGKHRQAVMDKLGIHHTAGLTRWWLENNR